jgi:exodeoxyribonuclease III
MRAGVPVVLAGDYNVVPTVHDIYATRSLDNNALIQPESRKAFARLLAQGWIDALRRLQPEGPLWTFWDYKRDRWPADKGMRLDHLLLSPILSELLVEGGVDRWVRGEENASDHAPAWIGLDLRRCAHASIGFGILVGAPPHRRELLEVSRYSH